VKARLHMLTLSIALGGALAQTTPPNPPPQETQQSTTPTNPQTNTQPDVKTGTATGLASATPAKMKTATFKGVLVDMACSSRTSASAEATPAAGGATQPSDPPKAVEQGH
jgi:hypothetical protein